MTPTPVDLVAAHPWERVAFTTYALSLSFFEAVILDALVRGGATAQTLILADVDGVRASIGELGARRVGKDYDVEPVAVTNGVFHPKISVFLATDECHVLVGSGNLTFGGWGGNCEVFAHLHPSVAADAITDIAHFFEAISAAPRVRHGVPGHCTAIAAAMRRAAQGRSRNGDLRVIHSLNASVTDQIVSFAADLGGARRLVAAAPFWDSGAALDGLCEALSLPEVFIHSHRHGCVTGLAGDNWPRRATRKVHAVRVALLDTDDERDRLLHAKAFEILCKRGRILVSGSANGTTAALQAERNIEVCLVRIQRERPVGWRYVKAEPLDPPADCSDSEVEIDESHNGVLRATVDADDITGQVLTPKMRGAVSVYHLGNNGQTFLANAELGPAGTFEVRAPGLEPWAIRGDRVVIRVEDSRRRKAEGFASIASFADISRRAGIVGRRLFALISGSETPADVAAILSWFHEDPARLTPPPVSSEHQGRPEDEKEEDDTILVVEALSGEYGPSFANDRSRAATAHRNWSRFVEQILLAFRQPRGPFEDRGTGRPADVDDDDDRGPERAGVSNDALALAKSLAFFTKLFDLLTEDGAPTRNALIAFDLTQYVCDRLRPEPDLAKAWLERLMRVLVHADIPDQRREDIAAGVLTLLATGPNQGLYRWARGCMLRLGIDLSGEPPKADRVRGFHAVLLPQASIEALWPRLSTLRTFAEQIDGYAEALERGQPSDSYPDLPSAAPEEWPALEAALTSPLAKGRLAFVNGFPDRCPHCHIKLPSGEVHKLRSVGVATAKNCCRRTIISRGA